jgi:hypothetical protein
MEPINNGFEDAAVTTHLCEVVKDANNMTLAEFEISQYIDPQLDKYFRVLRTRTHDAIDTAGANDLYARNYNTLTDTTICICNRDMNHKHLHYSKTPEYLFNNLDITLAEYLTKINPKRLACSRITFGSILEKLNFAKFIYSNKGFRFIAKVATAVNCDSAIVLGKVFPKVDWTRAWTVEEILADYGYTEAEIAEVMVDLSRFKDMERD